MLSCKRFLILVSVFASLTVAGAAVAGAMGLCLEKATKEHSLAYKACNDQYGTTPSPERSACIQKADEVKRQVQAECMKLPND